MQKVKKTMPSRTGIPPDARAEISRKLSAETKITSCEIAEILKKHDVRGDIIPRDRPFVDPCAGEARQTETARCLTARYGQTTLSNHRAERSGVLPIKEATKKGYRHPENCCAEVWTTALSGCGRSCGIRLSMGRQTSTAATPLRISPPAACGGQQRNSPGSGRRNCGSGRAALLLPMVQSKRRQR